MTLTPGSLAAKMEAQAHADWIEGLELEAALERAEAVEQLTRAAKEMLRKLEALSCATRDPSLDELVAKHWATVRAAERWES